MKEKNFKTAQKYLLKAIDLNPDNDVDLWLLLGKCSELIDVECSLHAYEKALMLLIAKKQTPPFELFNNVVVLQHRLGKYTEAKELCEKVLFKNDGKKNSSKAKKSVDNNDLPAEDGTIAPSRPKSQKYDINPDHIVLLYNYGLVMLALGKDKKCHRIMSKVLKLQEDFIEALLVIAVMYRKQGNTIMAISHLNKAIDLAKKKELNSLQIDARLLLAETFDQQHDRTGVRDQLEMIANEIPEGKHDPYSILLNSDMIVKGRARKDRKKDSLSQLVEAARGYCKVLMSYRDNALAAHGLGVVYAELGELEQAKSIFQDLREATNMPELSVNLGNICAAHKHWDAAIKLYEKALRQLPNEEYGDIPNYLARALFAKKEYKRCKQVLLKALRQFPTNEIYLYNYAYTCEMESIDVLRQDNLGTLTLENAEESLESLKVSLTMFENLQQHFTHIADDMKHKITEHIAFVKRTIQQAHKIVEQKHKQFAKKLEVKQKEHQKLEDLKKKKTAEQLKHEKNDELRRKELQKRAKKRKLEVESMRIKYTENESKKRKGEKGGGGGGGGIGAGGDDRQKHEHDELSDNEIAESKEHSRHQSKRRKFNISEPLEPDTQQALMDIFEDDSIPPNTDVNPNADMHLQTSINADTKTAAPTSPFQSSNKPTKKRLHKNVESGTDSDLNTMNQGKEELSYRPFFFFFFYCSFICLDLFGDGEILVNADDDNEKEKADENKKDKKKKGFDPEIWKKMSHRVYEIIQTTPNIQAMTFGNLKRQLAAEFDVSSKFYKEYLKKRVQEVIEEKENKTDQQFFYCNKYSAENNCLPKKYILFWLKHFFNGHQQLFLFFYNGFSLSFVSLKEKLFFGLFKNKKKNLFQLNRQTKSLVL
ncbi:hypothetical protein RFI_03924 [Reticulomyxa filosa]|uniref:TPR Domain containing protein n=1 Tax=Reticulomyxa filosa TaxID=46433 RepID=X6P3R2_RETFI|nr:hypothetical protein RFI_03924 [Reticulomyxa filosa]|eukprot:ETO33185.1 hypothetical protein RFI_03924 [Reticulomyxa filosa]